MRDKRLKRKLTLGYINSFEVRKKMSLAQTGILNGLKTRFKKGDNKDNW